jgi:hypothetical protein
VGSARYRYLDLIESSRCAAMPVCDRVSEISLHSSAASEALLENPSVADTIQPTLHSGRTLICRLEIDFHGTIDIFSSAQIEQDSTRRAVVETARRREMPGDHARVRARVSDRGETNI